MEYPHGEEVGKQTPKCGRSRDTSRIRLVVQTWEGKIQVDFMGEEASTRIYPRCIPRLCLSACLARNPGIAPSRYEVPFLFLLFWFVGGMYDDLTFYQVRIIGGEMRFRRWVCASMLISNSPI